MKCQDKSNFSAEHSEKFTVILDKMVEIASPENAFTKPVQSHNYTVIGVSEVMASMGVGFGGGSAHPLEAGKTMSEGGSGGGGGGVSLSRPVASIVISQDSVIVKPIFDFTKITIAAITAIGSMAVFITKILRPMR